MHMHIQYNEFPARTLLYHIYKLLYIGPFSSATITGVFNMEIGLSQVELARSTTQ